jgi:hypothetical protein
MIGVTIGTGEWKKQARDTAHRMEAMTGIPCFVIEEDAYNCAHPSWLKCHIHRIFPNADSFLVFDADILPLRGWEPDTLFEMSGRAFMGVPEPNASPAVLAECKAWGLGYPDTYLNGGLLLFGREHAPVWDRTWSRHPQGGAWMEQTALNRALIDEAVEVCRLPRRFNLMAHRGRINPIYARATLRDAINVHTCAMPSAESCTEIHGKILAYHETGKAGRTRSDLLRDLPKNSTGAELGVFCGDFTREILATVQPKTLHLVDLFEGRVTSGDKDGRHMRTVDMAVIRGELEALGHPVIHYPIQTHASDSVAWLEAQPFASFDWVYIDTTHEYEHTLAELRAARLAVKPGGIIAGHDLSRAFPGVFQAVAEFADETQAPLEIYDGDLLASFAFRNE